MLNDFAVKQRRYLRGFGAELRFDIRPCRAESIKALAARPLGIGLLNVACSDVVKAGITENVLGLVAFLNVMCPFADDNGKLAFVIEPMADFGVNDSLSAGNDTC